MLPTYSRNSNGGIPFRAIVHAYETTPTEETMVQYNVMAEDRPRDTQYVLLQGMREERDIISGIAPTPHATDVERRGHWAASCPSIQTRSPSPSTKRHQSEKSPRRTDSQPHGNKRRDRSSSPHRNQQPQLDYNQIARALAVYMEKQAATPTRQRSASPNQRHEDAQQEKPWQMDTQQERNRTQDAGSTPGRQVHFAQSAATEPPKDEQKSEEVPHVYLPNN